MHCSISNIVRGEWGKIGIWGKISQANGVRPVRMRANFFCSTESRRAKFSER